MCINLGKIILTLLILMVGHIINLINVIYYYVGGGKIASQELNNSLCIWDIG
jgi:hypothetical protein